MNSQNVQQSFEEEQENEPDLMNDPEMYDYEIKIYRIKDIIKESKEILLGKIQK